MELTGQITKTVYQNGNFSIRSFKSFDSVELPNGKYTKSFKIKGSFVPNALVDLVIKGEFDKKPFLDKTGRASYTFNVESSEEAKIAEQESILKYLCSLRGVGVQLAKRIYDKFGNDTFNKLDNDIELLKEVDGIGSRKYELIKNDYLSRGTAKELYVFLYQFHVSNRSIDRIFLKYGANAKDVIGKNPYMFYLQGLISYDVANRIAKGNNLDMLSDERIQASIVEALKRTELEGNTYLTWVDLMYASLNLLDASNRTYDSKKKIFEKIRENAKVLLGVEIAVRDIDDKKIFYRSKTIEAEEGIAIEIHRLLDNNKEAVNYDADIEEAEKTLGISLSEEQKDAVRQGLNSSISIVTGGPGTGKTSFQQVLLYVFRKRFKGNIVLGAPTGRAARRMTESSGMDAKTVHQILGLVADDDEVFVDHGTGAIDAGLVIIDEMSMIDTFLAYKLFKSIKETTKLICVGDVFQLPSVGCGAVLKDLIDSEVIPVTRFTKVFRQAEGSIIASNAAEINKGNTNLKYGSSFVFIQKDSSEEIVEQVKELYADALKEYGPDQTTVLTPYRRSTKTGVNELNPVLKALYNPYPEKIDKTNKIDSMEIYLNDKVMFTKNLAIEQGKKTISLSNGDIGYVIRIKIKDNVQVVTIDFQDGRVVDLMDDELRHLVLAYATTIHKSQGSEYKCCIIIVDPKHSILLQRAIIYTAITRSKETCYLVGDLKATEEAIKTPSTTLRSTKLKYALINT